MIDASDFSLGEMESVIREVIGSGGEFEMYPRGTSMLPTIKQGRDSVVLVKPPERLKAGDIALYKRKTGQFVLHRVLCVCPDGTYTMCGDNQTLTEPGITHDMVIARVARLKIKGKTTDESDKRYMRRVRRMENMKYRRLAVFTRRKARAVGRLLHIYK